MTYFNASFLFFQVCARVPVSRCQVYDYEIKIYPNYVTCLVFTFQNIYDIPVING